jgi:hypothetical protein
MDQEGRQPQNTFRDSTNKLFNSDSDTSLNSEASSYANPRVKKVPTEADYSNYSKLFERKSSDESIATKSSSSIILEDYNSFKQKLNTKRKLHK